jgi:hypothetical protein
MKTIFTAAIAFVLILFSCGQRNAKEDIYLDAEKVFDQAISVHDEVMPLMGDIMKLQSTLKEKKTNLSDEETIQKINKSLQDLEDAHSLMMDWMRNITPIPEQSEVDPEASDFISSKEMLKIQEQSLEEAKEVKTAILESINEANSLINEL